jgi:hypothetical protein
MGPPVKDFAKKYKDIVPFRSVDRWFIATKVALVE